MDTKTHESGKSPMSLASTISLLVGLAGIAASLFIFYSSREHPGLRIEQLPSITYASTSELSDIGTVELTVNGDRIPNLRATPFLIRNTGNLPVSSIEGSINYNLSGPIILQKPNDDRSANFKVVAVQVSDGDAARVSINSSTAEPSGTIAVKLQKLNVGESVRFTILHTSEKEPRFSLLGNPIIGGPIEINAEGGIPDAPSFWYRFKSEWLATGLGILMLSQLAIVAIWLAVGARNLRIERMNRGSYFKTDPLKEAAEKEQAEKIMDAIEVMIAEIDGSVTKAMKDAYVKIPIGYDNTDAKVSIYDLFKGQFKDKWEYTLADKYPLPKSITEMDDNFNYVSTPWLDWGDYIKEALLPWGLGSVIVTVFGYFILFV